MDAKPAPKSGFAIPRSRWLTEPEARPAAGWSKVCLRPCFLDPLPGPWAMPRTSTSTAPRVAITTDSFVVKPLRFPGGSIGELAVNGTVNDLAVSGARAEALVVTYVLEAGLPTPVLEAEVRAMAKAARDAGVSIAGGDTKVVEHGKADRMYITTTGIGRLIPGVTIDPRSVRVGDKILLSGPIGDHGITILLARGELDLEADLRSDTRSVLPLVEALVRRRRPGRSLDARSDPRRRRYILERTGARLRAGHGSLRRSDSGARCRARRMRVAGTRSAAHRQ